MPMMLDRAFPSARLNRTASHAGLFLSRFLRCPKSIGSPFASATRLAERLLAPLPWPRFRTVVEFGSGTGTFTRYALDRMSPDGRFLALETDRFFTRALREEIRDTRLSVIAASAGELGSLLALRGIDHVDCIISGIPFSALAEPEAELILSASARYLGPDGIFTAYQVRRDLGRRLPAHFSDVRQSREWLHVPPCRLYWASCGTQAQ